MMREMGVLALLLGVLVYAQINWFRALLILIVYTAVTDHPGVPNPIQMKGVTDWSLMLLAVAAGWLVHRVALPRPVDVPISAWVVVGLYLLAELIATARLALNVEEFEARSALVSDLFLQYSAKAVFVDMVYTPVRYMFMGFMLLDGIRSSRDLKLAIAAVLAAVVVYALIVNRQIPLGLLLVQDEDMRRVFQKWTTRNPNDLARDLAAAFWTLFAATQLRTIDWRIRLAAAPLMFCVLLALAHSHSRGGYLGFVVGGLALALAARWWRIPVLIGGVALAVALFAPNIVERVMTGFDAASGQADVRAVTAGRSVMWAAALDHIQDSPLIGHGAYGYVVSGAMEESMRLDGGELHPHNAYLQSLLDHGILMSPFRLLPLVWTFGLGVVLLRTRRSDALRLAGAAAMSFSGVALTMGLTGQQFGLTQNMYLFWCVAGLTMRAACMPDVVCAPLAEFAPRETTTALAPRRRFRPRRALEGPA